MDNLISEYKFSNIDISSLLHSSLVSVKYCVNILFFHILTLVWLFFFVNSIFKSLRSVCVEILVNSDGVIQLARSLKFSVKFCGRFGRNH